MPRSFHIELTGKNKTDQVEKLKSIFTDLDVTGKKFDTDHVSCTLNENQFHSLKDEGFHPLPGRD